MQLSGLEITMLYMEEALGRGQSPIVILGFGVKAKLFRITTRTRCIPVENCRLVRLSLCVRLARSICFVFSKLL